MHHRINPISRISAAGCQWHELLLQALKFTRAGILIIEQAERLAAWERALILAGLPEAQRARCHFEVTSAFGR